MIVATAYTSGLALPNPAETAADFGKDEVIPPGTADVKSIGELTLSKRLDRLCQSTSILQTKISFAARLHNLQLYQYQ